MRGLSLHTTAMASLLLLGFGSGARAQDLVAKTDLLSPAKPVIGADADRTPTGSVVPHADPLAMDQLLIDPPLPATVPDLVKSEMVSPAVKPAVVKPGPQPKAAEKTLDPEPDVAVRPPPAATTHDPLDGPPAIKVEAPKPDLGKGSAASPADAQQAAKPDSLSPMDAAIKLVLDKRDAAEIKGANAAERRKERAAVSFLYASHGFAPIWSDKGAPIAAVPSVLQRLSLAGEDGLDISAAPSGLAAGGTPDAIAASDVALTEAVVAYARQASGSRVDPATISPLIGVKRGLADPAEVIEAVTAAGSSGGDRLQAVNPIDPRYVALREQLVARRATAPSKPQVAVPAGPTLRLGMHDKRVPLVRARLALEAPAHADSTLYDADVADAVEEFQREKDLPVSGTLTRRTVEAMAGVSSSRQVGTLLANMEMWRWMPRDLGADHIEVNVPDFVVTVYHAGAPVSRNRVVVGKIDTPTPLFSNTMKYLIVNPYWNVPQSIIKNELLPKGHGSLAYLDGRGYSVSSQNGMPVVKQLPGDKNALGRIKFLFPNDYSVYLHDTPSKPLFASAKRAFSHGCVRVDKPFAFAESVLNDGAADGRKTWSQDRLESMIGDKERYVNLPTPLPIHIEYFTASVDDGGALTVKDDVYGYANAVAAALGQEATTLPIAGRVKPKPVVFEAARRQPAVAERTAAVAPTRSFWDMFDPR